MADRGYTPIDLAAAIRELPRPPDDLRLQSGEATFRGVPFSLTPLLVEPGASASVPVGADAAWLVFAHRLVRSEIFEGGPIGVQVAELVITLEGGRPIPVAIRERFEIAAPELFWRQIPFLAVWDRDHGLAPRLAGPWDKAGLRQTEIEYAPEVGYALFPWRNPDPARAIASVAIGSVRVPFVLAGITRSSLEEHPFRLAAARDVIVTLPDAELPSAEGEFGAEGERIGEAAASADLRIEVDRGLAGYPYTTASLDAAAGRAGWGQPVMERPSPTYAKVAATPSATLRVSLAERELAAVNWGELVQRRAVEPAPGMRIEIGDEGRNWVRTRVLDAVTGEPLPCRIAFHSAHGVPYAPHGHHAHVNSNLGSWHQDVGGDVRLGQVSYAYIDGTCEGWLPRGEVHVEVARGFEYQPLRSTVTIEPGSRTLELRLDRVADMNARGWYSGDTHVHFLSSQGALTEAAGEGLDVVNLLQAQWGSLFTNTEDFTGAAQSSRDGRTIVWVSQENRQHRLGHMSLLGLRRPVMPWSSDGYGEAEVAGTLDTTMSAWADRAHAQGATVVIPHFPNPNGETAALIATGRADAVEMIRYGTYEHLSWYRYLNAGYRLPLVGGTDKMSSDTPVGIYRTYVRIPADEPFDHEAWCRNLRLGRTFHSGGPLLSLRVEGHDIGDTLELPAGGGTVDVEAAVESIFPVHTLQLVHDGEVIAAGEAGGSGRRRLDLRERVRIDRAGWLAVRTGGPGYWGPVRHHDSWQRQIFAHTSPVYVAVGEPYRRVDAEVAGSMLRLIDGALGYIRELSPQADPALTTHHHGEPDHMAYLARPYLEAREAVERRLRERGR